MARAEKWKFKSWYSVIAPKIFDERKIGDVLALEDANVMDRIVIANLGELTGELPHGYTRVHLKVKEIKGKTAYTALVGHELIRSYLRTIVRRRMSLVDDVVVVQTKDGINTSVKSAVVTANKISGATRIAIRKVVEEFLREAAAKKTYDQLMQEVLFKKLSSEIYKKVKVIAPIKRVEIIKTEVVESKKKGNAVAATPAAA